MVLLYSALTVLLAGSQSWGQKSASGYDSPLLEMILQYSALTVLLARVRVGADSGFQVWTHLYLR
jgi:hypothetical protein